MSEELRLFCNMQCLITERQAMEARNQRDIYDGRRPEFDFDDFMEIKYKIDNIINNPIHLLFDEVIAACGYQLSPEDESCFEPENVTCEACKKALEKQANQPKIKINVQPVKVLSEQDKKERIAPTVKIEVKQDE